MNNKEIQDIIKRYLAGDATESEKAMLESWYLKQDVNAFAKLTHEEFLEDLEKIGEGLPSTRFVRRRLWLRPVAAAAAIIVIVIGAYLVWPSRNAQNVRLSKLEVPSNQKQQIKLADNSSVWVNAGSELQYPKSFDGNTREVYLHGEAYFDIHHDAAKPFIIHTGNVVTTVLGTAFDIKEDKINHTVSVTVTRGKVSVAEGKKQIAILVPDQQVTFNLITSEAVKKAVNAAAEIGWYSNEFNFEDITFADAAAQLQLHFNVKINFANEKLKTMRFSGRFLKSEKLDQMLREICAFNDAVYRRGTDGTILITSK